MANEETKKVVGTHPRIADNSKLTDAQMDIWNQLENKKLTVVGKKAGEFHCAFCGGPGKMAVVVVNEKGEERLVGAGCLKTYYNLSASGGRSGKGRGITL